MRLIAPTEYRRMPWKNGGGTTFEVAMHPAGADWGSFAWRASIADIAAAGPFSSFPGIDRTLVLLRGARLKLHGIGEHAVTLDAYEGVSFRGEAQVDCELPGGPVRDFNFMTRRGVASATVHVVRHERESLAGGTTFVCHAAAGACACTVEETVVDVPEGCTLVAETARVEVDARAGAAIVGIVDA